MDKKIIWEDSFWLIRSGVILNFNREWYVENGIIHATELDERTHPTDTQIEQMDTLRLANGYMTKIDQRNYFSITNAISKQLFSLEGEEWSCFEDALKRKAARANRVRKERHKNHEEWEKLKSKFNGKIIGIDKDVDVYPTGFSIRIILNSDISDSDKKQLVKEQKQNITKWAIAEMATNRKISNRIGDIHFYRPTEIIILKIQQLELKFEVKNMEVFERDNGESK